MVDPLADVHRWMARASVFSIALDHLDARWRYLRAQAELCLEMARQVSDRATADNLRAEAARYHAEATEIETGVKTWVVKAPPEED